MSEETTSLWTTCATGDDQTCLDLYGDLGTAETVCCWRAELVSYPAVEGDVTQEMVDQLKDAYELLEWPTAAGESINLCVNGWLAMYPGGEIPDGFEYMDESGSTWKGNCDAAVKTVASVAAAVATLVYASY